LKPAALGARKAAAKLREPKETPMPVDAKYKTSATATGGGRDGKTALTDGTMALQLVVPKELGGPGGDGANPEKLFALGYSACYLGAMRVGAQQLKTKVPDGSTVTATIGIGPRSEGGFGITAALDVYLPGMPDDEAKKLTEATHNICPYSNAIKASVDVKTTTRS
jgi:lipoyl-dependent peroxiredoxin